MFLETSHPNFSMAMELLCLLPREPKFALLRDIAEDLRLGGQKEVRHFIGVLRKAGYNVKPAFGNKHATATCAHADGWDACREAGEKYHSDVYGY